MKGLVMFFSEGDAVRLYDGRTVYVTDTVDNSYCRGVYDGGVDSYRFVFPVSEVVEVLD